MGLTVSNQPSPDLTEAISREDLVRVINVCGLAGKCVGCFLIFV